MGGTAVTAERVIAEIHRLSLADLADAFARVGASSTAEVVELQLAERRARAARSAARLSAEADPVVAAARTLAIGEWIDYGRHPREAWDLLDDDEKDAETFAQLRRARYLLAAGGLTDPTVRAS